MLQMGISLKRRVRKRERERIERQNDMREPGFRGTGPGPGPGPSLYFSGKLLYFKSYIDINVRSCSDPYLKTECSLHIFVLTRFLCLFTVSSGLETN